MKAILCTAIISLSLTALANNEDIVDVDDLRAVALRVDKKEIIAEVHYPNYRIGGGNGAGREIQDCFLLDVIDSDHITTVEKKWEIAQLLSLHEGYYWHPDNRFEMEPEVKGQNIVFKTTGMNLYMTHFIIKSQSGENLADELGRIMPPTRSGNYPSQVNLLYVRDCRF
ncbi:MAG: hypothetical protein CME62_06450 [Halobacteriovoraceae bacterium]|nr:hypothetical protein [Halobacteriovoraceae bacterium]|tara:strand:- start:8918 stop:9424 length:507 start_codon:yes stop_codon:yes gene_type:complete